jgi:hypothetical protein
MWVDPDSFVRGVAARSRVDECWECALTNDVRDHQLRVTESSGRENDVFAVVEHEKRTLGVQEAFRTGTASSALTGMPSAAAIVAATRASSVRAPSSMK